MYEELYEVYTPTEIPGKAFDNHQALSAAADSAYTLFVIKEKAQNNSTSEPEEIPEPMVTE
jgi:hypothetical protein